MLLAGMITPCPTGEAGNLAHVEKPFDLLVDAADRLDPAVLVNGTGHREGLVDRRVGKRRQQGEELGGRGAVAFDPAIGLLENQTRVERERSAFAKAAAEKAGEDQHTLRM